MSALVPRWFLTLKTGSGGGDITCGLVSRGPRLFHVSRADSAVEVSKYCAVSAGFPPGTLWERVPAGISPLKPLVVVNARKTLAETPGRGRYPMSRASSRTESRSVAVAR